MLLLCKENFRFYTYINIFTITHEAKFKIQITFSVYLDIHSSQLFYLSSLFTLFEEGKSNFNPNFFSSNNPNMTQTLHIKNTLLLASNLDLHILTNFRSNI